MAGRGKDKSKSQDIGWNHFTAIDDSKKKVKCKWCGKTVHGGIFRGKEHLAGIVGNVKACTAVPIDVRTELNQILRGKKGEKLKARAREQLIEDELTGIPAGSTDENDSDSELQRALRESREVEMNEQLRRRGEGSSRPRVEIGRSASMRAPEVVPFSLTQSQNGHLSSIFKLSDYDQVVKCLKKLRQIKIQDIPYKTRLVVQKFAPCTGTSWIPLMEGHCTDEQVEDLLSNLPASLRNALLPFQLEGVRFGLRRGGRCLIADEMGLGKTLQAIAIACCFRSEGSILIVCPAVLRYSWAEELERWIPIFLPNDIHLVFGHQNSLHYLEHCPKVVIISYRMLSRLKKSMIDKNWALMIIDESHNIRCTKKKAEKDETKTILELATTIKRIVLLSGTPSLSR